MLLFAYAVITLAIVLFAARKITREGFLLADRSIPPWFAAMSLVVSKFGGGKILAGGTMVYLFGWSAMWFNIGFVAGYLLFIKFAFRLKDLADNNQFYTMTDYYKHTAGDKAVWPIGLLCFYTMLGFTCINIVGGAHILSKMSGIDYNFSVLFVSFFIGSYLLIGGFKSVVVTDVLQAAIIAASMVLFVLFVELPGDLMTGSESFFTDFVKVPILYTFFMGFFFSFGMPEVWPRIYALRSKTDLKTTIPVTIVTYVALGVLLALLIIAFRDALPNMPPAKAILTGFQTLLPEHFGPIIAVFLFAAIMSSADTYLFQTNAALEQDLKLWDRIFPKQDSVRLKMRISIVVILCLALSVAFTLPDIVKTVLIFAAGNFILGVFGICSRFVELSARALIIGTITGVLAIAISALQYGIGFHVPLMAIIGTFIGLAFNILWSLVEKRKLRNVKA